MAFIQLTHKDGTKLFFDPVSLWEIYDQGDKPAIWTHPQHGQLFHFKETFGDIYGKLLTNSLHNL